MWLAAKQHDKYLGDVAGLRRLVISYNAGASNPAALCEPSQKGFLFEWPHRQRNELVSVLMMFPSASTKSTMPVTRNGPLAFT